jgi:hypothetical protein
MLQRLPHAATLGQIADQPGSMQSLCRHKSSVAAYFI